MSTRQPTSLQRALAAAGLVAVTGLLLAGCVSVDRRPQVVATTPTVVSWARVVSVPEPGPGPLPAPCVETPTAAPSADWHWVPGHWEWSGRHWRWIRGEWVRENVPSIPQAMAEAPGPAPSPSHVWIQGHWRWGGHGWIWVRGTWIAA